MADAGAPFGRRVGDHVVGRRETDAENAQAAAAGTTWLTRQLILGLCALLFAVGGSLWAFSSSQTTTLAARFETLALAQAADARQLSALAARSDATDQRLGAIDHKLDGLDAKLDRILTAPRYDVPPR